MRTRRLLLLCGLVSMLASSCQTSRSAFQARHLGPVMSFSADTATTVLLLHDSQGPQATRVQVTAAEAAAFRQQ
ncbi:hypothetical protein MUN84_10270 [Hymenobacter sp. 5516J-16]|uniref:Uncharacterized protein n=1 Tax=Hymenobacter sublimis TaxID=2933777 RepID=A0ABY4J7N7_9BACT|nr:MULTISPECIES: hypothetical protein [Hymenobacter]UOQ78873.1 hypothetical protein MUN84_10270 [Hymenobacter sp. 5516J-16]UPL48832.1 hypothetical protein MWH26_16800 [Hymenobacter sublimis]